MGAYLSQPNKHKVSTDEFNELLAVGASSMQGWRNSQEDAHNSILEFDDKTSFFAVYDGHGGAEVAAYCADKLPGFLKRLKLYQNEQFEQALKDAFLSFDKTLLEPRVVDELKFIAGETNVMLEVSDEEEDEEDLVELHEESNLPLNEVLEKYKGGGLSMPELNRLKEGAASGPKPQSPYLRGRRAAAVAADAANKAVMDPDAKPQGSSTSAAAAKAAAAAAAANDAGPSSSKAAAKLDSVEPEEDSTVSSSSSSASKSANNNSSTPTEAECVKANTAEAQNVTTNGSSASAADSSHVKESEQQNGSVTSSESKPIKADASTSGAGSEVDATVSGSNEATKKIQNGTVGSTSSALSSAVTAAVATTTNKSGVDGAAISSTSKDVEKPAKLALFDDSSTDDDADYDAENSSAEENDGVAAYPSDDEMWEGGVERQEDDDEEDDEEEEEEDESDDEGKEISQDEEAFFLSNMIEEPGKDSGCTAVVALLRGRDLYVANAGDSRCVVCRKGIAVEMSQDHKPEDEEESTRILNAGGTVTKDGRVNGGLNLSRAIGDHAYKMNLTLPPEAQMISALPDVRKLIITPEDEFMVLACDGIWNFMTSEEVVEFVRVRLQDETKKLSQICEELFDHCLAPNTMGDGTGCDNMTAVIVRFKPSILDLPTKLDPKDVVTARSSIPIPVEKSQEADKQQQQTVKRAASPLAEAEIANQTKRLKTDEEISSKITTTTITNTTTAASTEMAASSSSSSSNNNNSTAVPSAAEEAAAVSSILTEQKAVDELEPDAHSVHSAVSST